MGRPGWLVVVAFVLGLAPAGGCGGRVSDAPQDGPDAGGSSSGGLDATTISDASPGGSSSGSSSGGIEAGSGSGAVDAGADSSRGRDAASADGGAAEAGPPCAGPCAGTCVLGRCLEVLATGQGYPSNLTVSGPDLYFLDTYRPPSVMKVPVAGGALVTLAAAPGANELSGIAVDATRVYWAGNDVQALPVGGGSPTTLAASKAGPGDLAIDSTTLFFLDESDGAILSVPLAGGAVSTLATSVGDPVSIAIDGASVYWADGTDGAVRKVARAGGPVTVLGQAPAGFIVNFGIAVDARNVYWVPSGTSEGFVLEVPIGGGTPTTLARTRSGGSGVTVDGQSVYWTAGMYVMKVPIAGGTPTTLATKQNTPGQVAVDATSVYWTDYGAPGAVMKVTPK